MPKVILVDANSVGYAGQHAVELSAGGQPTQAIYNTLANLRAQYSKSRGAHIIFLWDSRAQFRFDLNPAYKSLRSVKPEQIKAKEEYHSQQPFIKKMLSHLGISQCTHEGFEADDLGYHLTNLFVARGYEVKLISSDKDWLQMVGEGVTWYDPRMDRTCTAATFQEFTGCPDVPNFIYRKAILGDKSDCIDGIPGLGDKACDLIFSKWPTIAAMVGEHRGLGGFTKENIGPEFSRYIKKMNAFCNNEDGLLRRFQTNVKIMDLSKAPKIEELRFDRGRKNKEAFFDMCGELAFASILRQRTIWENLFFAVEADE